MSLSLLGYQTYRRLFGEIRNLKIFVVYWEQGFIILNKCKGQRPKAKGLTLITMLTNLFILPFVKRLSLLCKVSESPHKSMFV